MKYQQQAIALFVKQTKYKKVDLLKIKQIHNGFTNVSFYVKTKDLKEYQIRIGNNKVVDRQNEINVIKNIKNEDYLYFDVKSGNAIKKWIVGVNPSAKRTNNLQFLKNLCNKIQQLHQVRIAKKIRQHDFFDCWSKTKLPTKHKNAYQKLVAKIDKKTLVISHNDLSCDNLLVNKKNKIHFIDYEWSRLNHPTWDIANFIRETSLTKNNIKFVANYLKIDLQTLLNFIYICINYAYQWTFVMPQTALIKRYRLVVKRKLESYYRLIKIY